ncbi:hypothetical protein BJ508DRAFT_308477 [Ascobolus immersus RN42]|uniref:Uncharacterized protein n=1 Tax=Ascobolus immersus RN42 TaxID=1160509 RepID=A0A3N4I1Q9_ASCIM|nr:hypothetical protein BJ508DRAFT_308477 [Ascobolus immersus RN42]
MARTNKNPFNRTVEPRKHIPTSPPVLAAISPGVTKKTIRIPKKILPPHLRSAQSFQAHYGSSVSPESKSAMLPPPEPKTMPLIPLPTTVSTVIAQTEGETTGSTIASTMQRRSATARERRKDSRQKLEEYTGLVGPSPIEIDIRRGRTILMPNYGNPVLGNRNLGCPLLGAGPEIRPIDYTDDWILTVNPDPTSPMNWVWKRRDDPELTKKHEGAQYISAPGLGKVPYYCVE